MATRSLVNLSGQEVLLIIFEWLNQLVPACCKIRSGTSKQASTESRWSRDIAYHRELQKFKQLKEQSDANQSMVQVNENILLCEYALNRDNSAHIL